MASSSRPRVPRRPRGEVCVSFDVGDGHVRLLDLERAVAGRGGHAGVDSVPLSVFVAGAEVPNVIRLPAGRTHVWQMPIRQPNGIWIPTFSPASRIVVAPSISMVLSDFANVTVPPSPPLSVRAMANRSMCSGRREPRGVPRLSRRVQHRRGSARPCRPVPPVGDEFVEVLEVDLAVHAGELHLQPVPGWLSSNSRVRRGR